MISAEQILREYIAFEDVNGDDTVELLPLTIVDMMIEYAEQACIEQREICSDVNAPEPNFH